MLQQETLIIIYLTTHHKRRQDRRSQYKAYLVIKNLDIIVNLVYILFASTKKDQMCNGYRNATEKLWGLLFVTFRFRQVYLPPKRKNAVNFQDKAPRLRQLIRH